mgnify:CR=1 FL=1
MKKTTSAILTLIAALTTLLAISCNSSSTGTNNTTTSVHDGEILTPTEGSTVFVRMDSLLNQYDMFLDLRAELEEKVKRAQSDLETK